MNDMTFAINQVADAGAAMARVLDLQKAAHIRDGAPSADVRLSRINRCIPLPWASPVFAQP